MPAERFDFANAQGEKLAALLDRPDGPIRAVALFAHCFTCGKDNKAARLIAHGLTSHGIAVLRFDFTGLGSSEGEFANTTFSSNIDDLMAAADHLRMTVGAPAVLIGHSLGGAAVLAAAHRIAETRAVVTIAAPFDPAHVAGLFGDRLDEIESKGEIEVTLVGRPSASAAPCSPISPDKILPSASPGCARRCWSSIRRPTRQSASTMPAAFSRRQNIRKASFRSPTPIICCGGRAMPLMSRMSSPLGLNVISKWRRQPSQARTPSRTKSWCARRGTAPLRRKSPPAGIASWPTSRSPRAGSTAAPVPT